MVRFTLIEEPAGDEALIAVQKAINPALVQSVHVLHNSDPSGAPSPLVDVATALQRLGAKLKASNRLESLDFVGHGAPGTLRMGATAAGTSKVQTSHQTEDWALLDSDVNKFDALYATAEILRDWRKRRLLAPGFQVRMLGCNTAVDPGVVPDGLMTTLQDGVAFLHLMASFFDVEVAGSLGYFGVESFDRNGFKDHSLLRTCECGTKDGEVFFKPAKVPTGSVADTKARKVVLEEVGKRVDRELKELLELYEEEAVELQSELPLVIMDDSIPMTGGSVHLVEEGKAVLIRRGGRFFRARASSRRGLEAQHATLAYLYRRGGPLRQTAPSWARRLAPLQPSRR